MIARARSPNPFGEPISTTPQAKGYSGRRL